MVPKVIRQDLTREPRESGTTRLVTLTENTGTVEIETSVTGSCKPYAYGDTVKQAGPPRNEDME